MLVPIGAGTRPGVQPPKALGDSFVLRGRGVGDDLADQDAIRQRGEENVIVRRGGSYSKTGGPSFPDVEHVSRIAGAARHTPCRPWNLPRML